MPLSEKALRGRIQHIGHSIDLKLTRKAPVPKTYENELNYLLGIAKKQKITFDKTLQWVLSLLAMSKIGLNPHKDIESNDTNKKKSNTLLECKLLDVIKKRRSVRQWTSEDINIDEIMDILNIAKWAPSSCNRQLWKILLLQDAEKKEFAGQFFSSKFIKEAPLLIFILMDKSLYAKNQKHYVYLDAGGFIQSLLLCMHGMGYGACWLGFKCWDSFGNIHIDKEKHDKFYEFFKLDPNLVPVSLVSVGRPKIMPNPPARQSASNFIIDDKKT